MDVIEQAVLIIEERLGKYVAEGSADAIARRLEAQNIQAVCGNAGRCAIAEDLMDALTAELGAHGLEVEVSGTDHVMIRRNDSQPSTPVRYMDRLYYWGLNYEEWLREARAYYSTNPINEFIRRFDNKEYPKLVLSDE